MTLKIRYILALSCVLFLGVGCRFGGTEETQTTSGTGEEGSAEACGNGICDSIEEEKGLCSQDCDETSTQGDDDSEETSQTQAEEETVSLSGSEEDELMAIAEDAYEEIAGILDELESKVDEAGGSVSAAKRSSLQEEIDALVSDIDAIAQETEYKGIKPLYGTGQESLTATDGYRSAGTPWQRIKDAVNALEEGNQQVEFTYSFIIEGTGMENGESLELKDQQDGSVSHDAFKQDITEALAAWEALFEQVFNTSHGYGGNLEVVFTNLGDESGNSYASNKDQDAYELGDEGTGDFRYGMETYESLVTGTPFGPTTNVKDGYADASGDVHFNSQINWRTDGGDETNATSVLIVAAHESGHGMAFQHEDDGLMSPGNIVRGVFYDLFPGGLFDDSAVVAATVAMYGSGATTTSRSIVLDDGTDVLFPAVNAAVLGVSAIKVRTVEESERGAALVASAQSLLETFKQDIN